MTTRSHARALLASLLGAASACGAVARPPAASVPVVASPGPLAPTAPTAAPVDEAPAETAPPAAVSALWWNPEDPGVLPGSFAEGQRWLRDLPTGFVAVAPDIGPTIRDTLRRPGTWYVRASTGCVAIRIDPASRPDWRGVAGQLIGAAYVDASGSRRRERLDYVFGSIGPWTTVFRSADGHERWKLTVSPNALPPPATGSFVLVGTASQTLNLEGPTIDQWREPEQCWQPWALVRCLVMREVVSVEPTRVGLVLGPARVRAYHPERVEHWYSSAAECEASPAVPDDPVAQCGSLVPPPTVRLVSTGTPPSGVDVAGLCRTHGARVQR